MADRLSPVSSRIAGVVIVGSIGSLLAAALLAYFAYAANVVDVPDFGGTYIEGTLGPPQRSCPCWPRTTRPVRSPGSSSAD